MWLNRFANEDLMRDLGMVVFELSGIEILAPLVVAFVMALSAFILLIRSSGVRSAQQ